MKVMVFDIEHSKNVFKPWEGRFILSCIGYKLYKDNTVVEENVLWFDHRNIQIQTQAEVDNWIELESKLQWADIIVGHNIKHDIIIASYLGGVVFDDCKLWCTMNSEYIIRGQDPQRSYSLEEVATIRNLSAKNKKINQYWLYDIDTPDIPYEIVHERVLSDVDITYELFIQQYYEVHNQQILKVIELQNEFQLSLSDMEINGLKVDKEKAEEILFHTNLEIEQLENELKVIFKEPRLNLNSNKHLSAVLFGGKCKVVWRDWVTKPYKNRPETRYYETQFTEEVEFPRIFDPPKRGETKIKGTYKVDKTTISQLNARSKVARHVKQILHELSIKQRISETLHGKTDTSGLLNKIQSDGCVHTNYNTALTSTGRLSSSNPNLQNLPREGTSPIKLCIIPRYDFILQWDLSQIEWRAAAWLSQDSGMIYEINNGIDQHIEACTNIMKLPFIDKHDPESKLNRTYAKIFNFRMIFGGSPYGFFLDPKMPSFTLGRWREIVSDFWKHRSGLKGWHDFMIAQTMHRHGLIEIPTGRRFQLHKSVMEEGVMVYPENCIKNYPVQGISGADILPLACVIIRRGMRKMKLRSKLILTVHDSIVFDVIAQELAKLVKLCEIVGNNLATYISDYFDIDFNVKLDGECEYGPSYGQLTEIKSETL
jgi:DNA polymerase I-like protein with 3'-5' exonuclease and polymerase domains